MPSLCNFPAFDFGFSLPTPGLHIPTISIGFTLGFVMPPCPLD